MEPTELLSVLFLLASLPFTAAHPQCRDFYPPFEEVNLRFCTQYGDFGCCVAERDGELESLADTIWREVSGELEPDCRNFLQDVLCLECSPYAAHLFNAEGKSRDAWADFPGLCTGYCLDFHEKCSAVLPFLTNKRTLLDASAVSGDEFCEAQEIDDIDYCFPSVYYNEEFNEEVRAGKIGSGEDCLCLEEFANGLLNPLAVTHANDNTHRLYVAEQSGRIHVFLRNGSYMDEPFLDIQDLVHVTSRRGDERGLLGLAFHPDYRTNRMFYIHYTTLLDGDLQVRISELRSFANDTNRANPLSERVLIEVDQPASNHNGGSIFFAPDGYLYISLGDGGNAGDPFGEYGNGLNITTFLGKILRIDVDRREGFLPYGIPPDNPFAGWELEDAFPEIFAYGARNMWRCSVDRGHQETGDGTGRIFCGDVGQDKFEEIDIVVNGGNYGWRAMEGFECYDDDLCNPEFLGANYVDPIHAYPHSVGKSVTGGHVYRGCLYPHLQGRYIYGDYWTGRLFRLDDGSGEWVNTEICLGTKDICTGDLWNYFPVNILSFGEDEAGELYMAVTDSASSTNDGGKIFRFVDPNKRGNPSECQINEVPVPIFGTISDFQPSNQGEPHHSTTVSGNMRSSEVTEQNQELTTKLLDCPNQCPDLYETMTKKRFCKSYYAIVATVNKMTNYNDGTRLVISDINVLRKRSYVRSLKRTDELLLSRQSAICSCPDVQVGKTYFFLGNYRFNDGGKFALNIKSVVREYHWYLDLKLSRWLNANLCTKS